MWEIPFYLILVPIVTLVVSLISTIKYRNYFFGPIFLFVILNIPTVVLPFIENVGWEAMFGWAVAYTVLSFIISGMAYAVHRRKNDKPISQ